jgi:hypothetical protein
MGGVYWVEAREEAPDSNEQGWPACCAFEQWEQLGVSYLQTEGKR